MKLHTLTLLRLRGEARLRIRPGGGSLILREDGEVVAARAISVARLAPVRPEPEEPYCIKYILYIIIFNTRHLPIGAGEGEVLLEMITYPREAAGT